MHTTTFFFKWKSPILNEELFFINLGGKINLLS